MDSDEEVVDISDHGNHSRAESFEQFVLSASCSCVVFLPDLAALGFSFSLFFGVVVSIACICCFFLLLLLLLLSPCGAFAVPRGKAAKVATGRTSKKSREAEELKQEPVNAAALFAQVQFQERAIPDRCHLFGSAPRGTR